MSASALCAEPTRVPPVLRRLAGAVVGAALLLQALLAVPLAVRMTAEAMQWLDLGLTVCSHAEDGTLAGDSRPSGQPVSHDHAQCQLCQGAMLPFGLLAAVLCLLAVVFAAAPAQATVAAPAAWRRIRYGSYLSRAPPAAV